MNIYQINSEIQRLIDCMVDEETGEIDEAACVELEALNIAREEKLENLACALVAIKREAAAVNEEKKKLQKREKSLDAQKERISALLTEQLDGEKLKSARVSVYYRKSESTVTDDGFVEWAQSNGHDDLLRFEAPTANLTAIKAYIEAGNALDNARIVQKTSLIVK